MKVHLDCKEVSRLISDGQDIDMPVAERARMRLHFVICETCRNVDEQMQFLRRAMRKLNDDDRAHWTALAFDLGARYVTFPPLFRQNLEDIVSGLMASRIRADTR